MDRDRTNQNRLGTERDRTWPEEKKDPGIKYIEHIELRKYVDPSSFTKFPVSCIDDLHTLHRICKKHKI